MSIAWVFPGQGAHAVGMGQDVAAASSAAARIFARADRALHEALTILVQEGPEETLVLTENAQPAILTTSLALLAAMLEKHPDLPAPAFAAGHSLGEYSALVAAGALSFEEAVRLVKARGRAMQDAVPPGLGAMAAVIALPPDVVEGICREAAQGEVVSPANFNAPGQIVIAGHATAVARAKALVEAAKGKVIPLKVSAPFHSALMASAAEVVEKKLSGVDLLAASFPVVANVDVAKNVEAARIGSALVRQVTGVVRWEETIRALREAGVTHLLEIGPGKVLAGLVKRIDREMKVHSVGDAASLDALAAFLEGAGEEAGSARTPRYRDTPAAIRFRNEETTHVST